MILYGYILPAYTVNAFLEPVFQHGSSLYLQVTEKDRIIGFEKLDDDGVDIITVVPEDVMLFDDAVYCFVTEKGRSYVGSKAWLKPSLIPMLFDPEMNVNARIAIASLYGMHGMTARLVKMSRTIFRNRGIDVILRTLDYVATEKSTHLFMIQYQLRKIEKEIRRMPGLQYADMLLLTRLHAYIGTQHYDIGLFLQAIPVRYRHIIQPMLPYSIRRQEAIFGPPVHPFACDEDPLLKGYTLGLLKQMQMTGNMKASIDFCNKARELNKQVRSIVDTFHTQSSRSI